MIFYEGKGIEVLGNVYANGQPDKLIVFEGYPTGQGIGFYAGSNDTSFFANYCIFQNLKQSVNLYTGPYYQIIQNCIFRNLISLPAYSEYGHFEKNVVANNLVLGLSANVNSFYCHFYDNVIVSNNNYTWNDYPDLISMMLVYDQFQDFESFKNNSIYSNFSNSYTNEKFKEYNISVSGQGEKVKVSSNYWGRVDSLTIKSTAIDFMSLGRGPFADLSPILIRPSKDAHGHVWKVQVNGNMLIDDFEKADPLGVAEQKIEVYFNRAMDIKYPPTVSMGVRYPFTQTAIATNGTWSADSTIYTVYGNIGLTTGDGINTIRVSGAKDTDHFEIPIEDRRFRVIVNAAGSASAEFQATAGLGKVTLEWNNAGLQDGLGFNMYRMEQINDSMLSQPVMINNTLVTDTVYTDFAVVPNKKYFYYYKILRTNLEETDSSKVVAAIPFTAALGDANGDLSVNVLDVTTIVAYLLNQNPQPFIFEAADVNGDKTINVLDIVATVNKVLNPGKSAGFVEAGMVSLYLQNDTLFADASVPVGAIQFDITNVSGIEEIEKLKALQGFESGYSVNDNTLRLIVYSLTGKSIAAGNRIPLLRMKKGSGITNMIMGDKTGTPLVVNYLSTGLWNLRELAEGVASLGQNYPNPFDKTTTFPVMVNEPVNELVIRIFNITGQEVAVLPLKNPVVGENLFHWRSGNHKGLMAYRLEISRNGKVAVVGVKKMVIH